MAGHVPAGAVRIVVVDDDPEVRDLVRRLLSRSVGWGTIVGEAGDGAEAVAVVGTLQPDICLLDVRMPTPGDKALPRILRVAPSCMVAVFSFWDTPHERRQLLDLGAFCYYSKSDLSRLVVLLAADHGRFLEALAGEDTTPTWLRPRTREDSTG